MRKLVFASATRKSDVKETQLYQSLIKSGIMKSDKDEHALIHMSILGHTGLPQVFNNIIEYAVANEPDDTILIFCHDDIMIEDSYLREKLESALKMYDVIGLAGTKQFLCQHPAVWNNCARDKMVGTVNHCIDGKYYNTYFGTSPATALMVDGIFIASTVDMLKKFHKVRFDQQFDYHFYDMDFCLTAYQAGLRVGVYPISLCHMSAGDWTKSTAWKEKEPMFLNKWSRS